MAVVLAGCQQMPDQRAGAGAAAPKFAVDPFWPKPLPDNWILGQVAGIAVDKDDHIWIVHRPTTLVDDEKGAHAEPARDQVLHAGAARCCSSTSTATCSRSWGGPGTGYDWPKSEHGIYVDVDGNVWLAGNGNATTRS